MTLIVDMDNVQEKEDEKETVQISGSVNTTPDKTENAALFLRLGLAH